MRQVQQQRSIAPTVVQNSMMLNTSRLPIALVIALLGTLLLTVIEALLLVFLLPTHLTGLLALPVQAPQILIIPAIEFVLLVLAVRLGSVPLAIYRYLKDVRTAK